MLTLQMNSGDYLTIGNDVVLQVFRSSKARFEVSIDAPREVSILRGDVRERSGETRPDGLRTSCNLSPSTLRHEAAYKVRRQQRMEVCQQAAQTQMDALKKIHSLVDGAQIPAQTKMSLLRELSRLDASAAALNPGKNEVHET